MTETVLGASWRFWVDIEHLLPARRPKGGRASGDAGRDTVSRDGFPARGVEFDRGLRHAISKNVVRDHPAGHCSGCNRPFFFVHRMQGYFRTAILMAAMTALVGALGLLLGGETGLVVALVIAAGMNVFACWNSDGMILRMHGGREVDAATAPDLYRMAADLASRGVLPMPKVCVMETDQPNTFANPASAHIFIINPLHAHSHDRLFSTHPSTANRVAALMKMQLPGGD